MTILFIQKKKTFFFYDQVKTETTPWSSYMKKTTQYNTKKANKTI